ncbi:MAG: 16S rRNA (adenine(1518)-N(6)/adenine(1519)-N(6))-dimethyltransferase RsmA [Pseudomonadota bacterium]|nr:16S rRNA (adenine(1518)-N(6)/adenine(1519)-N(6))-dimethyltransferase RsmA [Pseudomonadota bacterium]
MSKLLPRKRFGQHFLHDRGIITKIVNAINPQRTQHLVEIGPGLGALTHAILPLVDHLDAIEIDRDLIPILKESATTLGNLSIHEFDALQYDFRQLGAHLRVVGNLPYNISTPLIFHLLEQLDCIEDMHFMLQREVVDRLAAKPGNKIYGRLSVMVQYHCHVDKLFNVAPGAFNPPPEVDSAIVRLLPYAAPPYHATSLNALRLIVNSAFSQRRKTLRKSLTNYLNPTDWQTLGIDSQLRPEQLSVADFVAISNVYVLKTA